MHGKQCLHRVHLDRSPYNSRATPAWNASTYLTEYYSRIEPTEKFTLRFLLDALTELPPGGRAIDFGAGPTMHTAIALAGHVAEIHIADLLPENLRAIRRWQLRTEDAHDWSAFTREILNLEGLSGPTAAQVSEREMLARRLLTRVMPGNAGRRHPLGAQLRAHYGCVASFFCADSATSSLGEWQRYMRNILSLLAPGGLLVMGALRRCAAWRIGRSRMPSPRVDERHMQLMLDSAGFARACQILEVRTVPDQVGNGFDSLMLVRARAPA